MNRVEKVKQRLFIFYHFLFCLIFFTQVNSYSSDNTLQLSAKDKKTIEIYNDNGTKISGCQSAKLCVDPLPTNATLTKYYDRVKKVIYSPISKKREERLLYKVRYGYQKGNYWINGTGWIDAGYTNQPQLNTGGDSTQSGVGLTSGRAGSRSSGVESKQHEASPSKPMVAPAASKSEAQVKSNDNIHSTDPVVKPRNKPVRQSAQPKKNSQNEKKYPVNQKSTALGQAYINDFEEIIQRIDHDTALKNIESINRDSSKLINSGIGKCIATEDKIKENLHSRWEGKEFIYDEIFLPVALKLKAKPLNIKDENNNPISDQDLREIDVLARTIYAEVSNCFEDEVLNDKKEVVATIDTLEYPMLVAASAKNRVEYVENVFETPEFVAGNHHPKKGIYAKVLTTKLQYSPWNKPKPKDKITNIQKDYNALRHLLCPPRKTSEVYYLGTKPPPNEVEHFEIAVKMAMEEVLYPTLFNARTHKLWQFFLTSDVHQFYNMEKIVPSIHGRKLDNEACIIVWNGLPGGHKIDPKTMEPKPEFLKLVEKKVNEKKGISISEKDTGKIRRSRVPYRFYKPKPTIEHAIASDEPTDSGTP